MGMIFRNGVAFGGIGEGAQAIEADQHELLIGDGDFWAEGSGFKAINRTEDKEACIYADFDDEIQEEQYGAASASIVFSGKFKSNDQPSATQLPHMRLTGGSLFTMQPAASGSPPSTPNFAPEFRMSGRSLAVFEDKTELFIGENSKVLIMEGSLINIDGTPGTRDNQFGISKNKIWGDFQDRTVTTGIAPIISIHDNIIFSCQPSPRSLNYSPFIEASGAASFVISDKWEREDQSIPISQNARWGSEQLPSSQKQKQGRDTFLDYGGTGFTSPGPIARITGNATVDISGDTFLKIDDLASLQMYDYAAMKLDDQATICMYNRSNFYMSGNSDVYLEDNCSFQMNKGGGIAIEGSYQLASSDWAPGQIFMTAYRQPEDCYIQNYQGDRESKFWSVAESMLKQRSPQEVMENILNWNEHEHPSAFIQGNIDISLGSIEGSNTWKIGGKGKTVINYSPELYSANYFKIGGETGSQMYVDVCGGQGSKLFFIQHPPTMGKQEFYLNGGIFCETSGDPHIEMHSLTFVSRGITDSAPWNDQTETARPLSCLIPAHDRTSAYQSGSLLGIYDLSNIVVRGTWLKGGENRTVEEQTYLKGNYEIGEEITYSELQEMESGTDVSAKYDATRILNSFKKIHGVNFSKIVILSSEVTSTIYWEGSVKNYYNDVRYESYYQVDTPPTGWTGRAEKVPNNPLIEIIENSELTLEGNAILKVTSEGININGRQFTNEMLDNLIQLLST